MKNRSPNLNQDQNGIVAILVTIIIMIILSLIVLGFAKVTRREQRQALDRQLSTQAFYAAESGVNDAVQTMKADLAAASPLVDKSSCPPDGHYVTGTSNELDAASGTAYTCLLVNTSPPALEYDDISTNHSTIVPINSAAAPIASIKLSWQDRTGGTNFGCGSAGTFPAASAWSCDPGILRLDLVPVSAGLSRPSLVSSTMTAFFFPGTSGGGSVSYVSAIGPGQGVIVQTKCSNAPSPHFCNATITGLGGTNYMMRVKSIYKDNVLNITAYDASGTQLNLKGAQAMIDSTGKASDVLRRIQVHVPLAQNSSTLPDYALESVNTICKQMKVAPGMSPQFGADPACQP